MPCKDITEILTIRFSPEYKLEDYNIKKRTCGAKVGHDSFLIPYIKGKSVENLVSIDIDRFIAENSIDNDFLAKKHFGAIQSASNVLIGGLTGQKGNKYIIDKIEQDEKGVLLNIFISIDIDVSKNPGCGTVCKSGGCGKSDACNR